MSVARLTGVYALIDPRTFDIRYIGGSTDVGARIRCHLNGFTSPAVKEWLSGLRADGLEPRCQLLCRRRSFGGTHRAEQAWLVFAVSERWVLLNDKAGNGGGYPHELARRYRRRFGRGPCRQNTGPHIKGYRVMMREAMLGL